MFKTFDCLPKLFIISYTKDLHREFKNENSFCLLLTWPVTQLLYTQRVTRIQGKITALLPPTQSEKRAISRSHSAPGYDRHLGTLVTSTQQATNQSIEHRTFRLLFKVNSANSVVSLDFLHCLNLNLQDSFILPLIHLFFHKKMILNRLCVLCIINRGFKMRKTNTLSTLICNV